MGHGQYWLLQNQSPESKHLPVGNDQIKKNNKFSIYWKVEVNQDSATQIYCSWFDVQRACSSSWGIKVRISYENLCQFMTPCWVMHIVHKGGSHCQVKFLSKSVASSGSLASECRPIDMSKPRLFHLDNLRPQCCKRCIIKCLISGYIGRFKHVQKCASELDTCDFYVTVLVLVTQLLLGVWKLVS